MLGYEAIFSACFMVKGFTSKDILTVLLQSVRHLQNGYCGLAGAQPTAVPRVPRADKYIFSGLRFSFTLVSLTSKPVLNESCCFGSATKPKTELLRLIEEK